MPQSSPGGGFAVCTPEISLAIIQLAATMLATSTKLPALKATPTACTPVAGECWRRWTKPSQTTT